MTYKMIVLMGGQGVGKGTQAKRLIADNGFKYVEAGAILRALPPESPVAKIMAPARVIALSLLCIFIMVVLLSKIVF